MIFNFNLPKEGQVIYCRVCDRDLFRFKKNVTAFDTFGPDTLSMLDDQEEPEDGEEVFCSYCNTRVDHRLFRWPRYRH